MFVFKKNKISINSGIKLITIATEYIQVSEPERQQTANGRYQFEEIVGGFFIHQKGMVDSTITGMLEASV